jgi:nitrilase
LYAQDIDVYVAPTWDVSDSWIATMRHIAKEAGCWVIGTATAMQGSDVPNDFPGRDSLFAADEWINDGNAIVVKPMGEVVAGPLNRDKGILYAEIDKEVAKRARRSLDVCGHYARPDIFSFSVNRQSLDPVKFSD